MIFATRIAYHGMVPDYTAKLMLECHDNRQIECVLMSEASRNTVCVSTQVGCGIGCVFCASGLKGVERNLGAHEILEQVLQLRNLLPVSEKVTHIVVMGMGESLANFDNLINALDRICSPKEGLGISQRRVTISTVGLPEKIENWLLSGGNIILRFHCTLQLRRCAIPWCRLTRRLDYVQYSRPPIRISSELADK